MLGATLVFVADAPQRHDPVRDRPRSAELAPEPLDVGVDGALESGVGIAPQAVEQVVAGEHPARVRGQQVEQVELLGGEVDLDIARNHLAANRIDAQVIVGDQLGAAFLGAGFVAHHLDTAQNGRDPRLEFTQGDRLGEVVVGAELKTEHLVELGGFGREHHDRNDSLLPDPAADRESIDSRQHEIEDDQVRRNPRGTGQPLERLLAIVNRLDVMPVVPERLRDQAREFTLVFYDNNLCHE